MLVAPGYAERMENQLIVQAQFAGIEDGLPGPKDLEILRDAPGLVLSVVPAILARAADEVLVAIKPGMRLCSCHGHFLSPAAGLRPSAWY
jgi:hypothetical protein